VIRNREALATGRARRLTLDCIERGVAAARPGRVVRRHLAVEGNSLRVEGTTYDLTEYNRLVVLGAGNAAGRVAAVVEDALGDRIDDGVVVTDQPADTARVACAPGGHPLPSEESAASAERVRSLAEAADATTLVLGVVTGGGSALLAAPPADVAVADLRKTTRSLLEAGAPIEDLNAVRKHLSRVKGGRLARAAAPATVVALVFSDVVGDDPNVVASGPFAPDPTTYGEACTVVDDYDLTVPDAVATHLDEGRRRGRPESPAPDEQQFERVSHHVLANNRTALEAASEAVPDDVAVLVLGSRVEGPAVGAARLHVAIAEECLAEGDPVEPPAVLLSGGETTVSVDGGGRGGPNTEFALRAGVGLAAETLPVVVASVDTDGTDGASEAAGGIVDANTVGDPATAHAALEDSDAAGYLDEREALVETGSTGTNVNDLRVVAVGVGNDV